MQKAVLEYNEILTDKFSLLDADWKNEVRRRGEVLNGFIRRHLGMGPLAALDCACGSGATAIGLALFGYRVCAVEANAAALARVRAAAKIFGVTLTFEIADMRALNTAITEKFDVVLACDNTLSHLLTEADLLLAARQMRARLRRDGLLLIGLRDYEQMAETQQYPAPMATLPRVFDDAEGRRIIFQLWDWAAGQQFYMRNHFILQERQNEWQTHLLTTKCRALRREELEAVLRTAGFANIEWHPPIESGFYQPLVTARKK